MLSIHRLRLGLQGYLIPFATLAFVPQCQFRPSRALSPPVFFPISTHFTATPGVPSAPTVLQLLSFYCFYWVKPGSLTKDFRTHLQTLYAQSFRITLASSVLPRLLARSQPMLILQIPSFFFSEKRRLQPVGLLLPHGIAPSGFRPLRKIPHCCLPQKSGPCLSPSVADHPLIPTTDRRLGKLLPHQQANQTQAHSQAVITVLLLSIWGISNRFQLLSPS